MKHDKRPPSVLTRDAALKKRPVKNEEVSETPSDDGSVLLSYTISVKPFFVGLIRRFSSRPDQPMTKKIQLDALGTQVWKLIDGRRSVRRIIDAFADTNQLHPQEAEVSVTQFLKSLGKKGLIGIK
ncbi:MAG: PqqD family protein [Desulfobacteraceae bacterium]|nr:PqqD family protein [Desulfobacteraceae bacterium]